MPPEPMNEQQWKRQSIDGAYAELLANAASNGSRVLSTLASESPLVKGDGPVDAAVIIVGEAPGAEEVRQGRPFAGPSGKLLDELLPLAGLSREHCYVTNAVPFRPRANRTPERYEIEACRSRLQSELVAVGAPLVITLGATALIAVTGGRRPLAECHGQFMSFGEGPGPLFYGAEAFLAEITARLPFWSYTVMPTYHPSAALQDQIAMERIREDFTRLGAHCWGGIKRG